MCTACYATVGSLVGVALIAKIGGLTGLKVGAGVMAAKLVLLLRR